jgi:hypothetical protein
MYSLKDFLKREHIQQLLQEGNLTDVYFEYHKIGGDVTTITKFFISNEIEYLNHLNCIPPHSHWNLEITNIHIPSNIKFIGKSAFSECFKLTEVDVEEGVIEIYDFAFDGCNKLNRIKLPNSLTYIGGWVFDDCDSINIECYENSYAHNYCKERKLPFKLI